MSMSKMAELACFSKVTCMNNSTLCITEFGDISDIKYNFLLRNENNPSESPLDFLLSINFCPRYVARVLYICTYVRTNSDVLP